MRKNLKKKVRKVSKDFKIQSGGFSLTKKTKKNKKSKKRAKFFRKISKYFLGAINGIKEITETEEQFIAKCFYIADNLKNRQLKKITTGELEMFLQIKLSAFRYGIINFLDEKTRNFEYKIYCLRKNWGGLGKNTEFFKNSSFSAFINPFRALQGAAVFVSMLLILFSFVNFINPAPQIAQSKKSFDQQTALTLGDREKLAIANIEELFTQSTAVLVDLQKSSVDALKPAIKQFGLSVKRKLITIKPQQIFTTKTGTFFDASILGSVLRNPLSLRSAPVKDYQKNWFDIISPITTAIATSNGTEYVFGNWTQKNASVVLTCEDNVGGVGCGGIYYCTDNTNTCTPIVIYSDAVTIGVEGESYIRYCSNDTALNTEITKSSIIKINTAK